MVKMVRMSRQLKMNTAQLSGVGTSPYPSLPGVCAASPSHLCRDPHKTWQGLFYQISAKIASCQRISK